MSAAAIISLIVEIVGLAIKYGPEVAALIHTIISHIRGLSDTGTQGAFLAELSDLLAKFKKGGDKLPFLDLLRRLLQVA